MLAATIESPEEMATIKFPAYVSPKYDGVRGLTDTVGIPYTRKGEDFNNENFRKLMSKLKLSNLDFEIGIGSPTDKKFFARTSGWLNSDADPIPEGELITLYVFDRIDNSMTFDQRWQKNKVEAKTYYGQIRIVWVPQHLVNSVEEIMKLEEQYVTAGYEGVMIRGALSTAKYKHGRASMKSQELMKYKRFKEDEGVIIGFEEQQTNTNVATKDGLGHTKRSSAKAGKVPNGHMGKMIVQTPAFTKPIKIGTGRGLTKALRKEIWENQEKFLGRTVTFWHQMGSSYEKPRFASFKGFRDNDI